MSAKNQTIFCDFGLFSLDGEIKIRTARIRFGESMHAFIWASEKIHAFSNGRKRTLLEKTVKAYVGVRFDLHYTVSKTKRVGHFIDRSTEWN